MAEIVVELAMKSDGTDVGRVGFTLVLPRNARQEGIDCFLQEGVAHLKKELLYGEYTEAIPVPEDLWPHAESGKRTFKSEDLFTGRYEDVMNTVELWRLVFNVTLAVRIWLAKGRAYFEVWKNIDASDESLRAVVHYEKMDTFNLAAYGISKLRDVGVRIISESLGHSMFFVDYEKENWEESINAAKLQAALKERQKHERLRMMTDDEFGALTAVGQRLTRKYNDTTKLFLGYRNKLTHGNPASVDDSKYFHRLEDRTWTPILGAEGEKPRGRTRAIGVGSGPSEWTSETLYNLLVKALDHYVETLRMLKAIPTFGP